MSTNATIDLDGWHAERQQGVGGSDAAVVMRCSPFKELWGLWAEKAGLADPPDLSDLERLEWGLRLEAPIAEAYAERTGRVVSLNDTRDIFRHDEHDWMRATVDAMQEGVPGKPVGLLELKTASGFMAAEWKDEPPLHYQVQLQHQLAVTGMEWGTLCVLLGGQKMLYFDAERNDHFLDTLIRQEQLFWESVQLKQPPSVDGSASTAKALSRLYAKDDGESIDLPDEASEWDERLSDVKALIKELEGEKGLIENKIKAAIGAATFGLLPDGARYSWKLTERHDPPREAKTVSFRTLRRLKK